MDRTEDRWIKAVLGQRPLDTINHEFGIAGIIDMLELAASTGAKMPARRNRPMRTEQNRSVCGYNIPGRGSGKMLSRISDAISA